MRMRRGGKKRRLRKSPLILSSLCPFGRVALVMRVFPTNLSELDSGRRKSELATASKSAMRCIGLEITSSA
jgi:hypothetical protein